MQIKKLSKNEYEQFTKLFTSYYAEIECEENVEHLLSEYVLPDYEAELLSIALAYDGEPVGFVIYQVDEIDNEWCYKEGWGDVREIFVAKTQRGKGYGRALVEYAEKELISLGAEHCYALPLPEAEGFFEHCEYIDVDELCCELDCGVFKKELL